MWTDADSLIMDAEQSLERWTATDKAIVICQEENDTFTLNTGQFLVIVVSCAMRTCARQHRAPARDQTARLHTIAQGAYSRSHSTYAREHIKRMPANV